MEILSFVSTIFLGIAILVFPIVCFLIGVLILGNIAFLIWSKIDDKKSKKYKYKDFTKLKKNKRYKRAL